MKEDLAKVIFRTNARGDVGLVAVNGSGSTTI